MKHLVHILLIGIFNNKIWTPWAISFKNPSKQLMNRILKFLYNKKVFCIFFNLHGILPFWDIFPIQTHRSSFSFHCEIKCNLIWESGAKLVLRCLVFINQQDTSKKYCSKKEKNGWKTNVYLWLSFHSYFCMCDYQARSYCACLVHTFIPGIDMRWEFS